MNNYRLSKTEKLTEHREKKYKVQKRLNSLMRCMQDSCDKCGKGLCYDHELELIEAGNSLTNLERIERKYSAQP